jgi:hypothetical protein
MRGALRWYPYKKAGEFAKILRIDLLQAVECQPDLKKRQTIFD